MNVYFSPAYCETSVAFDTTRKAAAIAASLTEEPIAGVTLLAPRPVTAQELLAVHADAYVDAVLTGSPRELAATNGIGWDVGFPGAVMASNGGVRDAALEALRTGSVAGSLSSGLHHAYGDRGSGYCTFNGLVLSSRAALAAGAKRVLILDLDAHCGGGTASLIGDLHGVEQVDVAVDDFDHYASTANAWLTMSHGDDYLDTVCRQLDRVSAPAGIDLLLYNAGMDPHRHAGGHPAIDAGILAARESIVLEWSSSQGLPVAWVLAGGYTEGNEGAALDMAGLVRLHRLTISAAAESVGLR